MKKIKVSFDVYVPPEVSLDDVEEWLKFELHATGAMKTANPLSSTDLEAVFGSVLVDI